jgi:general stress protein 26
MTKTYTHAELEVRLWDAIKKSRVGMLGLAEPDLARSLQPMTGFTDNADDGLWFFTRDDTEFAQSLDVAGTDGVFVFQSKDQDLQACLRGRVSLKRDPEPINHFWNAAVSSWYPEGKKDPHLALLHFDARDAQVWLSEAGPLRFAWEVLKANATGSQPDIGDHASLNLRH